MAQQAPITTIPPFNDQNVLPPCATSCGPLHDANGACVPPAPGVATGDGSVYEACFCSNSEVSAFSTATEGICGNQVCDSAGLNSIASWFRDLCSVDGNGGNNDENNGDQTTGGDTTTTGSTGNSGGGSRGSNSGNGGDWISNHWQWVIMIVILVVAIAGIWVGACIWRRRYLKKKDRQSTLGQKQSGSASNPSWGPGFPDPSASANMSAPNLSPTPRSDDPRTKGAFMPGAVAAATKEASTPQDPEQGGEEPTKKKKRWIVKERT